MSLHIDKETELLFPVYDEMFSIEEQMAHGAAAHGRISQDAMAKAGAWAFQRLDQKSREDFLTHLKSMLPPEAFDGMSQGMMRSIPTNEWQELRQRLPGLLRQSA
jgi:hypothetical protein